MKFLKLALVALFVGSGTTLHTYAKSKVTPCYVFGFSASFADSTVYFTDIQKLDSTWLDTKTKFLLGREEYSLQLKQYFNDMKKPNRTCIVMFATDKKKIDKKYKKLKETYTVKAKGGYDVHYLNHGDFTFQPVYMGIEEEEKSEGKE